MIKQYAPYNSFVISSSSARGLAPLLMFLALGFLALLALAKPSSAPEESTGTHSMIAIEHTTPLTLNITTITRRNHMLVEVGHDAEEVVHLSIPSSWERKEVRGIPLSEILTGSPSLGFTRMTLPGSGAISFALPSPLLHLTLRNPSGSPVQVRLTHIDLDTDTVDTETLLIQEDNSPLW